MEAKIIDEQANDKYTDLTYDQRTRCACKHIMAVHSKRDGKCLGKTVAGAMTCLCTRFKC